MHVNSNTKRVSLVGATGKMGQMLTSLIGEHSGWLLSEDAEVVIDFSRPEGTRKAIAMGKPLVSGTTGLSEEIFEELRELAQRVPVLYAPNFSLGMTLFMEMLAFLKKNLLVETKIEETHHTEKADTPSGTAKQIAKLLQTEEIVSHRIAGVVGTHQVDFLLEEETIQLRHTAHSRKIFAIGALKAAHFLIDKPPGFYSLTDIFV